VKRVISVFDKNKDGKISFVEFISGLASLSAAGDEEAKIRFAFDVYDFNNDGFISNGDLFKVKDTKANLIIAGQK
jgi:serine/threonine-protein phosphatase 2B regulatory subunit